MGPEQMKMRMKKVVSFSSLPMPKDKLISAVNDHWNGHLMMTEYWIYTDEHTGPEKVEYVCSWCNCSFVRLTDRNKVGFIEIVLLNLILMMNRLATNKDYQFPFKKIVNLQ
jgi:hypothetical protein